MLPDERPGYALKLSTSVKDGQKPILDITLDALEWQRETRLQGGYWLGSFAIEPRANSHFTSTADLAAFMYEMRMAHVEEFAPFKTWEGFIAAMEFDDTPGRARLDVTVAGYIHTAAWRFCTVNGGASVNISTRINSLIGTDCEFLDALVIEANSTQVPNEAEIKMRAWDELLRLTEIGDGDNLYRIYAGNDRKMFYRMMSNEPTYFVKGGLRRRVDLMTMWNYVYGSYIDTDGNAQTLAVASNAKSIAAFGRREERLKANNLPTGTAQDYRDTFLLEYGWPNPRVVASNGAMEIYSNEGGTASVVPWQVEPGVFRDLAYPVSWEDYDSWYADGRDFIADRVTVSRSGVEVSTWLFDEYEQIAMQWENEADVYDRWERLRKEIQSRPLDAPDWGEIRRGNDPRDLLD